MPQYHQQQPQTSTIRMRLGAQGASVPAQALAPLEQDPPWALQEPQLGEFSSLTWTGQEHKPLLRGGHIFWLKVALQTSLLLRKGLSHP